MRSIGIMEVSRYINEQPVSIVLPMIIVNEGLIKIIRTAQAEATQTQLPHQAAIADGGHACRHDERQT